MSKETPTYNEIERYGANYRAVIDAGWSSPEDFTLHANCIFTQFGTFYLKDNYWVTRDGLKTTGDANEFIAWHIQQRGRVRE